MSSARSKATVSVLMPTFNRARYIGEALLSVLTQSHAPHEVLVLDDGSTDDTATVCAAFGDRVRHIHLGENKGKSAALNRGLKLASGAFIWVMDDDDIAPPGALAALLAPMTDPRVGYAFGRLLKFRDHAEGGKLFEPDEPEATYDRRNLFVSLMEDCFITGHPCTLIRRGCFDMIGPVDETVLASVDYNILLQVARRFDGADIGQVVLWQRQHRGLRGPVKLRYRPQQRVARWMAFDARLLADLLPQLALEEFLGRPGPGRPLSPRERRSALFQKAVIAARKNLWDLAFDSLAQARATTDAALTHADELILSRMLGSRYGIDALLGAPSLQRRLAQAAGPGRVGRAIRTAIAARLTFWIGKALRRADLARLVRGAATLLRVAGPARSARLALYAVLKNLGVDGPGRPGQAQQGRRPAAVAAYEGAQDAPEATA
jgi:hypothetical protein